jgi:hypothetical protein
VEVAAGVVQANVASRDPTVLCVFDEAGASVTRPDRSGPHLTRMLHRLADAAALAPAEARVDPGRLLPLAYAFAREVYPDLLRRDVNAMPWWASWLYPFPARGRGRPGLALRLYRGKLTAYLAGTLVVPALLFLVSAAAGALAYFGDLSGAALARILFFSAAVSALSAAGGALLLLVGTVVSGPYRRRAVRRKQLAALLALRQGSGPGGLAALLQDDDAFALALQQFLAEHRVPYALPLYDEGGRYRFAAPAKVGVLARALLHAVGRGHDNELFVLLTDLLELGPDLRPLLHAVRVALGRHHQVLVVCPWPPGLPTPAGGGDGGPGPRLPRGLREATVERFHSAYRELRRTFALMGVPVVCAAEREPTALILDRLEALRTQRRMR